MSARRGRRAYTPVEIGYRIASIPERLGGPEPWTTIGPYRVAVEWVSSERGRRLRVVCSPSLVTVELVRGTHTEVHVAAGLAGASGDVVGMVRAGYAWLVGDEDEKGGAA